MTRNAILRQPTLGRVDVACNGIVYSSPCPWYDWLPHFLLKFFTQGPLQLYSC